MGYSRRDFLPLLVLHYTSTRGISKGGKKIIRVRGHLEPNCGRKSGSGEEIGERTHAHGEDIGTIPA